MGNVIAFPLPVRSAEPIGSPAWQDEINKKLFLLGLLRLNERLRRKKEGK